MNAPRTTLRRALAAAFVVSVLAVGACRTPTQVTLDVTTNARCADQTGLDGDVLVDVGIAVGASLGKDSLASRGGDDHCEPRGAPEERDNWVGDLVVVPGDADGNTAEVVVVAGVERPNTSLEGDALRADAERCLALLGAPGGIEGKACIVSRRIVGFVSNEKLTLPILLSTRCVGVDCGEDETCSNGTCVSARITCDAASGSCERPEGEGGGGQGGGGQGGGTSSECDVGACEAACADQAAFGSCETGACVCSGCAEAPCQEVCDGLSATQEVTGACVDGACTCALGCDAAACDATCLPGTEGSCAATGECVCGPCQGGLCDEDCVATDIGTGVCEVGGDCVCNGTCQSAADCEGLCPGGVDEVCQGGCRCACDDDACSAHCAGLGQAGGACAGSGACQCFACPPSCEDTCNGTCAAAGCTCAGCMLPSDCGSLPCGLGQLPSCEDGACACVCEANTCALGCAANGQSGGCSGNACLCGNSGSSSSLAGPGPGQTSSAYTSSSFTVGVTSVSSSYSSSSAGP